MGLETLYIFDEHNTLLLEHVYCGRPPTAKALLQQFLAHPTPRPSVIYTTEVSPPAVICSTLQDRLLFLSSVSREEDPLVVLEFLSRTIDALEVFLGAPLLASKFERSFDVVAQIATEICDGGIPAKTDGNALQEVVEVPNYLGDLLGGFGLPATVPSVTRGGNALSSAQHGLGSGASGAHSNNATAIPWRRSNVRHTSNELYCDILENLQCTLAPSGRALSARVNGNIVFTAQTSGVPDLLLKLSAPGGRDGLYRAMDLPCFHPCVRLASWRDRGELSFIPPDGRFILASYECDLLPPLFSETEQDGATSESIPDATLNVPVTLELKTCVGASGDEIEVQIIDNWRGVRGSHGHGPSSSSVYSHGRSNSNPHIQAHRSPTPVSFGRFGVPASSSSSSSPAFGPSGGSSSTAASSSSPALEDIVVSIPLPSTVRTVAELRCSRGEALHIHTPATSAVAAAAAATSTTSNAVFARDSTIEWRLTGREAAALRESAGSGTATLRCTLVGDESSANAETAATSPGANATTTVSGLANPWDYNEDEDAENHTGIGAAGSPASPREKPSSIAGSFRRQRSQDLASPGLGGAAVPTDRQFAHLMPRTATLSFALRHWLASGLRVDALTINTRTSKGLGGGVAPYKGVRYHTVARRAAGGGIEVRA